jgi:hypothetical protein
VGPRYVEKRKILPSRESNPDRPARRYTTELSRLLYELKESYAGFEALTAVVMKDYLSWDITPCNPLKVSLCWVATCFVLIYCLAYASILKM